MIKHLLSLIIIIIILAAAGSGVFISNQPNISPLENIYGIPYPVKGSALIVTEDLAHADIYLTESVFAKELTLTVTFTPRDIDQLTVGIRENSFWLSYPQHELYNVDFLPLTKGESPAQRGEGVVTKTITIPLTDKLVDKNSVDLMFFATSGAPPSWELANLAATISPTRPTLAQTKNFLRSVITNEKAL